MPGPLSPTAALALDITVLRAEQKWLSWRMQIDAQGGDGLGAILFRMLLKI